METLLLTNPSTGEVFTVKLHKTTPRTVQRMLPFINKWPDPEQQFEQIALLLKTSPERFLELAKELPEVNSPAILALLENFVKKFRDSSEVMTDKEKSDVMNLLFPDSKNLMSKYTIASKILEAAIITDSIPEGVVINEDFWLDQEDMQPIVRAADFFRQKIKGWFNQG